MYDINALALLPSRLPPPDRPYGNGTNEKGRGEDVIVPLSDLEKLTRLYGVGWLNGYLKLYSPYAPDGESNLLEQTREFKEIVTSLANHDAGAVILRDLFADSRRCCFVWGGSINGETLLVAGVPGSTSKQVVIASADMEVVRYELSAAEFLFGLACGRIKGEFFSPQFCEPYVFHPGADCNEADLPV